MSKVQNGHAWETRKYQSNHNNNKAIPAAGNPANFAPTDNRTVNLINLTPATFARIWQGLIFSYTHSQSSVRKGMVGNSLPPIIVPG